MHPPPHRFYASYFSIFVQFFSQVAPRQKLFKSCVLLCPSLLLLLLLCCIVLLLVDLSQVMWGPSRHLGSLTAANWVSFDFNVSYSSC